MTRIITPPEPENDPQSTTSFGRVNSTLAKAGLSPDERKSITGKDKDQFSRHGVSNNLQGGVGK